MQKFKVPGLIVRSEYFALVLLLIITFVFVASVNAQQTLWHYSYSFSSNNDAFSGIVYGDGALYTAGVSDTGTDKDIAIVALDKAGNEKWVHGKDVNNNKGEDEFYNIVINPCRDIALAGRSQGDTLSFDFLTIKYQNSTSGIPVVDSNDPKLHITCYPNPFTSSTFINYYLPQSNDATLKIVDIPGKEVKVLVNGKQQAGNHTLRFNTERLNAGIYFCRIISGKNSVQTKMIVTK